MNMIKVIEKIKDDEIIRLIQENSKNADIYLVGGVIRDFCLGKNNFDKDIVVDKVNAEEFAINLAKSIKATFIPLDDENKIYRLMLKDKINCIDVAGVIGNSIEEDLKRRDLTINSIALNLKTLELIDINNGIKDLKEKKIHHISEQNFIDDPLRLLRAYRFSALLGFEIDKESVAIIKKHASLIQKPAIERINYEFLKLFSGKFSAKTLIEMDESGLLKEILPITQELKNVPPNLHHHLNLFYHSIEVVNQIQKLYENSSAEVKQHLDISDFGGATRLAHLKYAGLLHDIGKPSTWTIEEGTGRHRFIKHDDIGAKMGAKILKRNKFSKKQIDYISKMIKYHIYPSHVISAPDINEKIYMRLIRKMDKDVIDVIILAMADRLSARGVEITDKIVKQNIDGLQKLLDFYLEIQDSLEPLPKLISGNEIMDMFDIQPSKELGNIIKIVQEAQLSGDISTSEEAICLVKSILSSNV